MTKRPTSTPEDHPPRQKHPAIPLPPPRRRRRDDLPRQDRGESGWLKQAVIVVGWLIAGVTLAFALLRIFFHDGWIPLVWLNAFTVYIYLPVYVCIVVAICFRGWRLAGVCLAVIVCHVVWLFPDYWPSITSGTSGDKGAVADENAIKQVRRFRLYYQNLLARSTDYESRFQAILAHEPDVVALVEFNPRWEEAERQADVFKEFPFDTRRKRVARQQQMIIFSKFPIEDLKYYYPTRRLAVAVTLNVGGARVRLYCVHAPRPTWQEAASYREFNATITKLARQEARPLVLVGDFNATTHSAFYQQLVSRSNLYSAHQALGRGHAVTWPNGKQLVPPIRIDHVLLSDDVVCRSIEEGTGGDSDHKPLITDLEIPLLAPQK